MTTVTCAHRGLISKQDMALINNLWQLLAIKLAEASSYRKFDQQLAKTLNC